jgi:hypothetical protein
METDSYAVWAADAEILAEIGRQVSSQLTKVTVRLPKVLADQALASWRREDGSQPTVVRTRGAVRPRSPRHDPACEAR